MTLNAHTKHETFDQSGRKKSHRSKRPNFTWNEIDAETESASLEALDTESTESSEWDSTQDSDDYAEEYQLADRDGDCTMISMSELHRLISSQQYSDAAYVFNQLKRDDPALELGQTPLSALADGLFKTRQWDIAVPLMEEYIERFPDTASPFRIKLAGVLLKTSGRPDAVMDILLDVDGGKLNESQRTTYLQIVDRVQKASSSE